MTEQTTPGETAANIRMAIEGQERFVKSQLDDIERAQKRIAEAQTKIGSLERDLEALATGYDALAKKKS